tara:strand:- start:309 stop:839 length:531 start_codon:yes stop_codon:yes gene_type:complete
MKKLFFYFFGLYFFLQTYSLALNCDFNKFKIGKNLSNFEKEKIAFMLGEPVKGIKSITLPVEFICQDKKIKGTIISIFFIDDKVVRIIFQNQIIQNRVLFKLANSFYKSGFKKNQKLIDKNEPEQYAIEKNGIYHLYANLRGINENTGNFLEILEIVDKKHEDVSTKQLIIEEENE